MARHSGSGSLDMSGEQATSSSGQLVGSGSKLRGSRGVTRQVPYNKSTNGQSKVNHNGQHRSYSEDMTKERDTLSELLSEPYEATPSRTEQLLALLISGVPVPVSELAKIFEGTDDPVMNVYRNVPRVNERIKGKGKKVVLVPTYQLVDVKEEAKAKKPKAIRRRGRPQKSSK